MSNEKQLVVSIQCFDNEPAKQLSWVVRNFLCSICESHMRNTPTRIQAYSTAIGMVASAVQNGSIDTTEADTIMKQIIKIEEQIYPGCSLL